MLLSRLLSDFEKYHIVRIENEKPFDRFARTTSQVDGTICVYVMSAKFIHTIPENASMVITTEDLAEQLDSTYGICISKNPKATYFRGVNAFVEEQECVTFPTRIGKNCTISQQAYISPVNVVIGDNVVIEPFATVCGGVEIGNGSIIRSGVRLGTEDYNYFQDGEELIHLKHAGRLIIHDHVEIGYNSAVGKALYFGDETHIGNYSKIANGCGIGHDVQFADHVMVYAGCMIGGFVTMGSNAQVKMNCAVKNGISIGTDAVVGMASNVIRNVKDGETVFGNPAKKLLVPGSR